MNILQQIQSELKAPKGQKNNFGNYSYRSAEDILTAVKPLLEKHEVSLIISDDIVGVEGRVYVQATATLWPAASHPRPLPLASSTGFAREALTKKGMDDAQITGSASSYARKYALNGLFASTIPKIPMQQTLTGRANLPTKRKHKPWMG